MKKTSKRNKKTKPVASAHKNKLESDSLTATLDAALTSAEQHLQTLLSALEPTAIKQAFENHVHTQLTEELSNIFDHGHCNDDPEDTPERPDLPHDQDCTYRLFGGVSECSCDKDSRPEEWHVSYSDGEDNERYVISRDGVLIADCYADTALDLGLPSKEEFRANARIIAKAPQMSKLVNLIARMKVEAEDQPGCDEWISTLNYLIASARAIAKAEGR